MLSIRRAALAATCGLLFSATLIGCVSTTPATPSASAPVVATPAATAAPTSVASASVPATTSPTPTPTTEPTPTPTPETTQLPIITPVPGSSLDPTRSDAGVAGRLTIPDDTRDDSISTPDRTGTHEILGLATDGSNCSYSISGDVFTAVAWYDDAPNGMLHQMGVSVSADNMPSNDGEQRAGIQDARVFADFASDSGFGATYSGDANDEDNGGSSTLDVTVGGDTYIFTFTGTTWDEIDFSGQMICSGLSD